MAPQKIALTNASRMHSRTPGADTTYTLYFMQPAAERVARITHVEAPDVNRATEIARAWPWAGPIEIWQGDRLIGRLELDDGPWAA